MSKHELLAAHLRSLEDYRCNLAADALEAQARQITEMQQQESELCTLHAMAEAECKRLREDAALVAARERERIAAWIEPQRNDVPATGYEFALAIRALNTEDAAIAAKGAPHG